MPLAYKSRAQNPRLTSGWVFLAQWLTAQVLVAGLLYGHTWLKLDTFPDIYRLLMLLTVFVSYMSVSLLRVYDYQLTRGSAQVRLMASCAITFGVLTFIGFVTKTSESYSREVFLLWVSSAYVTQAIALFAIQSGFGAYMSRLYRTRKAVIIGAGQCARELAKKLNEGEIIDLAGIITPDPDTRAESDPHDSRTPVLGSIKQLRSIIESNGVSRVYLALPASNMSLIDDLYLELLDASVDIIWLPDFGNRLVLNHSIGSIQGSPAIYLSESPLTQNPGAALVKSIVDRLGALLGLIALAPLFVVIAIGIKLGSKGPVFFLQERHGLNGRIFKLFKFRSMTVHDDASVKQATKYDARITPLGRLIRKTSIDELPQLINVFMGDMSLVGPRPHAVQHNTFYSQKIRAYMNRHKVKPGMTGWAQVNGSRGETETVEKMQRRLELDLEYINTWSLALDLQILLKTPVALVTVEAY